MKEIIENKCYIFEDNLYSKDMESLWKCFGRDGMEIKNAYISLVVESQNQGFKDGFFNLSQYFMWMDKEKKFWKENCFIRIFEELGLLELDSVFINDNLEGWIHDDYVADYDYVYFYRLVELTDEIIEKAHKKVKKIFCVDYPFEGDQKVERKNED